VKVQGLGFGFRVLGFMVYRSLCGRGLVVATGFMVFSFRFRVSGVVCVHSGVVCVLCTQMLILLSDCVYMCYVHRCRYCCVCVFVCVCYVRRYGRPRDKQV
jgi:hypothetical protein